MAHSSRAESGALFPLPPCPALCRRNGKIVPVRSIEPGSAYGNLVRLRVSIAPRSHHRTLMCVENEMARMLEKTNARGCDDSLSYNRSYCSWVVVMVMGVSWWVWQLVGGPLAAGVLAILASPVSPTVVDSLSPPLPLVCCRNRPAGLTSRLPPLLH